jgi:hypothetical protein
MNPTSGSFVRSSSSSLRTPGRVDEMRGANKERWKLLCEQAAVEQDPIKLLELTREINDLLLRKQHRLEGAKPSAERLSSKNSEGKI